jgi:hypothetical protein
MVSTNHPFLRVGHHIRVHFSSSPRLPPSPSPSAGLIGARRWWPRASTAVKHSRTRPNHRLHGVMPPRWAHDASTMPGESPVTRQCLLHPPRCSSAACEPSPPMPPRPRGARWLRPRCAWRAAQPGRLNRFRPWAVGTSHLGLWACHMVRAACPRKLRPWAIRSPTLFLGLSKFWISFSIWNSRKFV